MPATYPQPKYKARNQRVPYMRARLGTMRYNDKRANALKLIEHKYVIANINPFNRKCYGARIPDKSTLPSTAFYSYDTKQWTLGVSDSFAAIGFQPSTRFTVQAANSTLGANVVWPNYGVGGSADSFSTIVSNEGTIRNLYSMVRPVAHGVRVSCPGTLFSVTGYLHMALVPFDISANTNKTTPFKLPKNVAEISQLPAYKKLPLSELTQNPMIVVNRMLDETSFRYVTPDSSWADYVLQDMTVTLGGAGTPSIGQYLSAQSNSVFDFPHQYATVVFILENGTNGVAQTVSFENIIHWEGYASTVAGISSAGAISNAPAEPSNPVMVDAVMAMQANRSQNTMMDTGDPNDSAFWSAANQVLSEAEKNASNIGDVIQTVASAVHPFAGAAVGIGRSIYSAFRSNRGSSRHRPYKRARMSREGEIEIISERIGTAPFRKPALALTR